MLLTTSNALGFPLLSLIVFLPLAGAALLALLPRRHDGLIHATALFIAGLDLVLALVLFGSFDRGWANPATQTIQNGMRVGAGFQFADPQRLPLNWLPGGISYQVGVDGISVVLVLLTTLLGFLALLYSSLHVGHRVREYGIWMLILQTGMLGVFTALDLFLFYVFWEASIIPMVFLIALWGGQERIYATFKFVLYTLAGSALMLVALVALGQLMGRPVCGMAPDCHPYHLFTLLAAPSLPLATQALLFGAFALAFAVKVPIFPFHSWLPDAHVQAPTAVSVILAGVLLKMGGYGILRFCLPLFPKAAVAAAPAFLLLAVIGIWYGAWVAFAQTDIKKLVAYSSVSHMGIVVLGLFSFNEQGLSGGTLQMINHGLSTGALFLLVGMLYERAHSRQVADFGGLWQVMPRFSVVFLVVLFSSIGLPGTNGFVGEWLSLLGGFRANMLAGALAAFGVVLGAAYMLWLYQRVFFGPVRGKSAGLPDLTGPEMLTLLPLLLLIFWIGVYPATILQPIQAAATEWLTYIDSAARLAAGG